MVAFEEIKRLIGEVLHLGDRIFKFTRTTPFLGSLPELDSVTVVSLLVALEERFGVVVEDDEVTAADFETIGSFYEFVCRKANS